MSESVDITGIKPICEQDKLKTLVLLFLRFTASEKETI